MSTKFRIADRFKGEVILPTVNSSMLSGGSIVHLNSEQLKNPHIKMAIRSGMLIEQDAVIKEEKTEDVWEGMALEELVDESVKTEEIEKVEDTTVNRAKPKGKRGRKQKDTIKTEKEESPSKKIVEEDKEITIDLDEMSPLEEKKTNMGAWNAEEKNIMGKDESAKTVMEQLNGVQIDVQKTTDTDEIDFNEELDKVTETLKKSAKKSAKQRSPKKTKKSLKPVGKKREVSDIIDGVNESLANEETMLFVDEEQDLERLSKRPELKIEK